MRRELPSVAVPELPEDPAWYGRRTMPAIVAVEVIVFEDLARGEMYRANAEREALKVDVTDMRGHSKASGCSCIGDRSTRRICSATFS